MWKETDIAGVYMAPILPYMLVALVAYMLLRPLLARLRFDRWTWISPLAGAGIYICILALLVVFL